MRQQGSDEGDAALAMWDEPSYSALQAGFRSLRMLGCLRTFSRKPEKGSTRRSCPKPLILEACASPPPQSAFSAASCARLFSIIATETIEAS